MRKHIVKCKVEGEIEKVMEYIRIETGKAYVEKVGRILKMSDISKEDKISIINRIQENFKKLTELQQSNR